MDKIILLGVKCLHYSGNDGDVENNCRANDPDFVSALDLTVNKI